MRQLFLLVACLAPVPAAPQAFQQEFGSPRKALVETMAVPDHADSRYLTGQQATLRLVAREGGVPLDGVTVHYAAGPEMFLAKTADSTVFRGGEALLPMGTMAQPGFLACRYEYRTGDGRTVKDLVKVAYEPERIRAFTAMPADFTAFWQRALREARRVPLEPLYTDVPDATTDSLVTRRVRLHVAKDKWIQGFLTMPRAAVSTMAAQPPKGRFPVVLCPPGAGSQKIYPSDYFPLRGCIYLKIEIHDLDQLLPDEEYAALSRRQTDGYTVRGMESPDTYYYKDVYLGCARAVDFLCSLPQWDGRNVIVTGGSQGGALTIVTAALSDRVTLCAPFYPALCDLTAFLHQRAGGWPKFFAGQRVARGRDFADYNSGSSAMIAQQKAVETLQYFDVVNFARQLRVPTFMSWGYSDDTCSPTSIWAAWNEISAPKQCDITPTSGHWRFASSQQRCWQWMTANLIPEE